MKFHSALGFLLLLPLSLYANKDNVSAIANVCSLHKEKVETYSLSGNYDSPWFKTEFWKTVDTLQMHNCEGYCLALNIAGYIHYSDNNILRAKEALFKSDRLIDKTKASNVLLQNQLFLGLVYVLEKDINNAIIYFERSLAVGQELNQLNSVADAKLNLGLAYIEKEEFDTAEHYLNDALLYFEQTDDYNLSLGYTYLNLIRVHDARNNLDQAIVFCDKAETIWQKEKHRKGIILLNVSKYHLYNGRDQTRKGIPFLLKAMDESVETDNKILLSEIYFFLGKAYKTIGEDENSLNYYKRALTLGNQLPVSDLTDLIDVLGEKCYDLQNRSEYDNFLSDIKNILINTHEEGLLESSKLFTNETLIDTLYTKATNLENINSINKKKIKNHTKTICLIILCSLFIMGIIYKVAEERKKLNLKIKNQYYKLKEANNKLVKYSSKIQDQNRQYEAKNKELKNFAYVASHDLKSPLRTITSFLGLLKNNGETSFNEKQLEYINIIEKSGKTLTHLIDDLLEHAELESSQLKLKRINCFDLLNQVTSNISEEIKSNRASIVIDKSISSEIVADEIKLYQVFQNLISNAIKYCDEDVKPHINISMTEDNHYYLFHLKDNGIGIKDEDQDKIFDMFEKVNRSSQKNSFGIGLATCRKIIDLHGGEIWLKSNPSQGSTFSFSIPKNIQSA